MENIGTDFLATVAGGLASKTGYVVRMLEAGTGLAFVEPVKKFYFGKAGPNGQAVSGTVNAIVKYGDAYRKLLFDAVLKPDSPMELGRIRPAP